MDERLFRWKKKQGTGAHYFKHEGEKFRKVPGDLFNCTLVPIKPFLSEYECLGEVLDGVIQIDKEVTFDSFVEPDDDFTLVVVSVGGGYYNVINPNNPDKPVNEKGLRKKQAYELAGLPVSETKRVKRVKKSE